MELWLSIIFLAMSIIVGAVITGYQIEKAIHADIKHSQEKLEHKIEKDEGTMSSHFTP